jgi:hypothetical protein
MKTNEIKKTGESELMMKPSSKNVWWQDRKESISGENQMEGENQRSKFKVDRLYWVRYETDGCQRWRNKAEYRSALGCRSEGDAG